MRTPEWLNLLAPHAARLIDTPLSRLAGNEPERIERDAVRVGPLYASFARQRLDAEAWRALYQIADTADLPAALRRLFDGACVNQSEQRPALHTSLRSDLGQGATAREARATALASHAIMDRLAERIHQLGITDLINIGIGGSDLGPRLLAEALPAKAGAPRIHFLSSPDGHDVDALLSRLDHTRTAVLLVSKSFSTEETLLNGRLVLDWLRAPERVFAATARPAAAVAFGVAEDNVLPMWDWVGGRYSLWSTVGFAIRNGLGKQGFEALLAGAALMDAHVIAAPMATNLPIRHALLAIWNRNALGYDTQAVLPYDQRLRLLPAYLQQLVMESLGKSVLADGSGAVAAATVPVLWGTAGTDCQHSYFQALHQGTDTVPAEFIGVVRPDHSHPHMHQVLLANLLAQSEALGNGVLHADPHRRYSGNRPSTLLLLDRLDPHSLGALIAMYEHSVYLQSVLWGINAFDQWGVELGKLTARALLPALQSASTAADPISAAWIAELRRVAATL